MRHLSRLALAALLLAPTFLAAQATTPDWSVLGRPRTLAPRPTTAEITPADLETRIYRFADDSMEGRILGSRGNLLGTEYIAAELRRLGLEPAGENGSYFQELPFRSRALDPASMVRAGGRQFTAWADFAPRDQGPNERAFDGASAVWAGDFNDADTRLASDQVAGKVVILTMSQDLPGYPPGVPNRTQVNAAYRTAAAIFIVAREGLSADDVAGYRRPSEAVDFGNAPALPAYAYISRPMAEALLGGPPASMRVGAAGGVVQGRITWTSNPPRYAARNVVAILRGSDPALRNEFVAVGAHNDHVGVGSPVAHDSIYVVHHLYRLQGADDRPPTLTAEQAAVVNATLRTIRASTGGRSARPDSIYNGADDDASGSMAVLEIAEQFARATTRPRRSLLFVWHVGEEAGLYGSQWFTDHPTVPRESIVAQLNIDMIGRGGAGDVTGQTIGGDLIRGNPDYVQVIGSRRLSTALGDLAESVNTSGRHGLRFDYSLDANGHPQNIYCRSDHYMYARYGIPVAFFTTGGHADYHQVTDEAQYLDYPHLTRVTRFVADLAAQLANLASRPVVDQPRPDPNGSCRQ